MPDLLFQTILSTTITASGFLWCTLTSLVLGAAIAAVSMFRTRYTKSFLLTLAILPAIVQVVIMLVNGNLGTGVAVMGAFSLVRFRSTPGSAREIGSIFLAMAVGLATGMGYLGIAAVFTAILSGVSLLYAATRFGEAAKSEKQLKVTIPESLDYTGVFDDLFQEFTTRAELISVKTTNMGSLYQLQYQIILKDQSKEKEMIDAIRCRNGNLDILCGKIPCNREEL